MASAIHSDLTYYDSGVEREPAAEPLRGVQSADVVIVGGGLAGLTAGLYLAEGGYRVTLLEAGRLGSGASGRNGGQVLPGVACGFDKLEQLVGTHDALSVWDLSVAGVQLLQQRIARHQIDCDWRDGHLHVANKPRQVQELRAWQAQLRDRCNYPHTQFMERDELSAQLDSTRYLAALYDPFAGHMHPLKYLLGIARLAQRIGLTIHENSRVTRYGPGDARTLRVQTVDGEIRCDHLLLTGNATLGPLAPTLHRKIIPVGTYMIATAPLESTQARSLIGNNASVSDMNWIIDYFRRSADDRLLFGGRVSYGGLEAHANAAVLRARMLAVFPQLTDTRIEYSWGGWLDITMNRAPHFGRLTSNVWFLQGFSGHGLALTGIAGRVVAEAIAGTSEDFDLFARIRHRNFPGGALFRRPLLALAMLWYRLRDKL
jgi:gamma-glutamylputrescine oxidase